MLEAMTLAGCPSCGWALAPRGNQLGCARCRGCFVETKRLEAMVEDMTRAPFRLDELVHQAGVLACPHCGSAMSEIGLFDVTAARCRGHGVWFAAGELARALQHAGGGGGPAPARRWWEDDDFRTWEPRDLAAIERDEAERPLQPATRAAAPVVGQSPYRDSQLACPACAAGLRRFRDRLCCDACSGIMLGVADLETAIRELTAVSAELGFTQDTPGSRVCPCCQSTMVRCRLDVRLMGERPALRPELDRCDGHGVWFDAEELAKILEVLRRVASTTLGNPNRPHVPVRRG
jgi:Zn-finger nucleic acid-binding protein